MMSGYISFCLLLMSYKCKFDSVFDSKPTKLSKLVLVPPSGQKLELVVRHGKILAGQISYQISLHTMHVLMQHQTFTCFIIISRSFKHVLIKSTKIFLQAQCTQHDLCNVCARVERAQFWSCLSTQSVYAFSDWR